MSSSNPIGTAIVAFDVDDDPRRPIFPASNHGPEASQQAKHAQQEPRPYRCWVCEQKLSFANGEVNRPYFRHLSAGTCPAHRVESSLHRKLKQLIVDVVANHQGWWASPEVAGEGWRADVLAEIDESQPIPGRNGAVFRPDTVFASERTRRVAFEVQVSKQTIGETERRTDVYRQAGVDVVWLLCWPRVQADLHPNAVAVSHVDSAFQVTNRVVLPKRGPVAHCRPISLEKFVVSVLDGETVPGEWISKDERSTRSRRRSWYPADQHRRFVGLLRHHESLIDLQDERRRVEHELRSILKSRGHRATRTAVPHRSTAYALIVEVPGLGLRCAVHPDPTIVTNQLGELQRYKVITDSADRAHRYRRLGFDAISIDDFEVPPAPHPPSPPGVISQEVETVEPRPYQTPASPVSSHAESATTTPQIPPESASKPTLWSGPAVRSSHGETAANPPSKGQHEKRLPNPIRWIRRRLQG